MFDRHDRVIFTCERRDFGMPTSLLQVSTMSHCTQGSCRTAHAWNTRGMITRCCRWMQRWKMRIRTKSNLAPAVQGTKMHCARTLMGMPHSDLHITDLYHHSLFIHLIPSRLRVRHLYPVESIRKRRAPEPTSSQAHPDVALG